MVGGEAKMNKEIHFYVYGEQIPVFHSWQETEKQIENGKGYIKTTQMGLLSTKLFKLGYHVFIHEAYDDAYEIVLGSKNDRINREIKMEYNLFEMWKSGEFRIRGHNGTSGIS